MPHRAEKRGAAAATPRAGTRVRPRRCSYNSARLIQRARCSLAHPPASEVRDRSTSGPDCVAAVRAGIRSGRGVLSFGGCAGPLGPRSPKPPPCSDGHTPNAIGVSYLGRTSASPKGDSVVHLSPVAVLPSGAPRAHTIEICTENWRRRPDLNRGWRFCRFRQVLYLVDSSCSLVSGVSRFSMVFGR